MGMDNRLLRPLQAAMALVQGFLFVTAVDEEPLVTQDGEQFRTIQDNG